MSTAPFASRFDGWELQEFPQGRATCLESTQITRVVVFPGGAIVGCHGFIQGEGEIGKSRLIHEFASHLISGSPR